MNRLQFASSLQRDASEYWHHAQELRKRNPQLTPLYWHFIIEARKSYSKARYLMGIEEDVIPVMKVRWP